MQSLLNNMLWCLVELADPSPVDYKWDQYEQTDKLIYVENNEVPIKPYQKLSGEIILTDYNLVKEEHDEQLLLPSNEFRKRALIDMMDGVLEKRWEDELKNDVPIPPCMVG
jgi:hypothetical protein